MAYNITNITNSNNILEMMTSVNTLSGSFFGIFILVSAFLVQFVLLKRVEDDTKAVLVVNSVLCVIESALLWNIGLLDVYILIYPILALVGSLIVFYIKRNE